MSISNTGSFNPLTGVVFAEGYAPSGEVTITLPADTYYIQTIPTTCAMYIPYSNTDISPNRASLSYVNAIFIPSQLDVTIFSRSDTAGTNAKTQTRSSNAGVDFGVVLHDGTNFVATLTDSNLSGPAAVLAYGTDGVNWQYKDIGATSARVATALSSVNTFVYNANVTNKYVFCVATNSTTAAVWTSTNFTTWTSRNLPVAPSSTSGAAGVVINSNATNKYILNLGGSASNQFCYSTDGATWTNATFTYASTINGAGATNNTASTNQIYVYPGTNATNNLLTSTDGVTWTSRSTGQSVAMEEIVFFDSKYYAFSQTTSYAYSTDGVTWTTATLPLNAATGTSTSSTTTAIIFNNKLYKIIAGYHLVTTNGTTWTYGVASASSGYGLIASTNQLYWRLTGSSNMGPIVPLYYKIYATNTATQIA